MENLGLCSFVLKPELDLFWFKAQFPAQLLTLVVIRVGTVLEKSTSKRTPLSFKIKCDRLRSGKKKHNLKLEENRDQGLISTIKCIEIQLMIEPLTVKERQNYLKISLCMKN